MEKVDNRKVDKPKHPRLGKKTKIIQVPIEPIYYDKLLTLVPAKNKMAAKVRELVIKWLDGQV